MCIFVPGLSHGAGFGLDGPCLCATLACLQSASRIAPSRSSWLCAQDPCAGPPPRNNRSSHGGPKRTSGCPRLVPVAGWRHLERRALDGPASASAKSSRLSSKSEDRAISAHVPRLGCCVDMSVCPSPRARTRTCTHKAIRSTDSCGTTQQLDL